MPKIFAVFTLLFGRTISSSKSWVSAASPSSSIVNEAPRSLPQVSTSVPSTATEVLKITSDEIPARARAFANPVASIPASSESRTRLSLQKSQSTRG